MARAGGGDCTEGQGLQIVGIDLDTLPEGGQKLEPALPNVRRFLLEYNVTWPTLINGQGEARTTQRHSE